MFCGISGDIQSSEALASGANDVVVVRQANGLLDATPVNLQIGNVFMPGFGEIVTSPIAGNKISR